MGTTVPKSKIQALIDHHKRRYENLKLQLKDGDADGSRLHPEEETEVMAQVQEIGHFIDQLEEILGLTPEDRYGYIPPKGKSVPFKGPMTIL